MIDVREVVRAVASVLPPRRPIGHHEPSINGAEMASVTKCLQGGIGSHAQVKEFERKIAEACGTRYALALASGTAALHLALLAAGVKPGDEVLVPALTFVATANAVVHAGAVPHFIDGALGINAYKLRCYLARTTERSPSGRGRINRKTERPITALIVVHLLGLPADMDGLQKVADDFGLTLIEDAAEALGSRIGNRACGSIGVAGILSFNNNKIVTTNGGGAIVSDDEWIISKAHQLATTARLPHPWLIEHDAVAFNYRMGDLNAALGCAQIDRLPDMVARKRRLWDAYCRVVLRCRGVELLGLGDTRVDSWNHWLIALKLDPRCPPGTRDVLLTALHAEGIMGRALFTPLHKLPMYASNPRDNNLLYAEDAVSRIVCLPSGADLATAERHIS